MMRKGADIVASYVEEKATKLALDDLSCESIKKMV